MKSFVYFTDVTLHAISSDAPVKIKRSHVLAAIVILVVGVIWVKGFWFTEVFRTHKSNEPHRTALIQIQDTVALGDSHADVLAAYWMHRTDSLRLFADRPTDWVISMRLELGGSDWKLRIEFQDGRVTALRVRMADGPPKDGPKDKETQAKAPAAGTAGSASRFTVGHHWPGVPEPKR